MRQLKFLNPVFNDGINTTIRRGIQWSLEKEAMIYIDGHAPFTVKIDTRVMPFLSLCDDDIKNEHNPKCRTYGDLLESMKKIHPGFSEREIIIIVEFQL